MPYDLAAMPGLEPALNTARGARDVTAYALDRRAACQDCQRTYCDHRFHRKYL